MKNKTLFSIKLIKYKTHLLLLFGFVLFYLPGCNHNLNKQTININNGKIELGFDKNTGELIVFKDLINSYEFLDTIIPLNTLWKIDFFRSSKNKTIDMTGASKFSYSKPNPDSLILTWDSFSGIENKDIKVIAIINLEKNKPLSSWKINIEGIKGETVNKVIFPIINGIKDLNDEYLTIPLKMGELIKNPRTHLSKIQKQDKKYTFGYPGPLSLQCFALYNPDICGIYAACNDTLSYKKDFEFTLDTRNNITYQIINYPGLDSTINSYSPPYESIIGSFKGDWLTAAEQYRQWGTKQKWCSDSRLKNNLVPSWLKETAFWVWNRGKSNDVLSPAIDLKNRIGLPVNVFWHWWHGCLYDDGFPEYFPPREGKESFVSAMVNAHNEGINAIVYMNSYQWGNSTKSWKNENASVYAVKDNNGNLRSHAYNIFTGKSLTNMCMATKFWKNKYSSLCNKAVTKYHVDGVYMDQACTNKMCYDTNHKHSIGGGNYWLQNFGKLTGQIRSKISNSSNPILAGEGCGEGWIPYLDAMLTLQVSKERYAGIRVGKTIPFFQAVYHQYAITYGNYSSLLVPPYDELWPKKYAPKEPLQPLNNKFNKQFRMEQARSFVWGMQPTIANYQSFLASERKDEIDYLINLAKVRYQGLKYLLFGKFLRSPEMNIPEEELNISKLSIYAGKKEESVTTYKGNFPLIYTGTWKSDDNNIGIALASISDDPYHVNFHFNADKYKIGLSGKIYVIDLKGKKLLAEYSDNNIKVDFMLPPKGFCIVEIVPEEL